MLVGYGSSNAVVLLFIRDSSCRRAEVTVELLITIPLSYLQNVTWPSSLDEISSIPSAIMPFNGASIPAS